MTFYGVADNLFFITTNYYLNQWLFTTITYQHSNRQLKMYLNGVNVASRTNTRDFQTDKFIRIGSINTGLLKFQGYMDDFRIYDTVLTQNEITNLYNKINVVYIPPKFVVGLAIEDADMEVYDAVSPYK